MPIGRLNLRGWCSDRMDAHSRATAKCETGSRGCGSDRCGSSACETGDTSKSTAATHDLQNYLCYGCQVTCRDMVVINAGLFVKLLQRKDQFLLPSSVGEELQRQQARCVFNFLCSCCSCAQRLAMKEEIAEFLLDDDDDKER